MTQASVAFLLMNLAALAATSNSPVTFNKDVLPVLQRHCQECHRPGEVAPMSFLSYRDVRPWAKAIRSTVLNQKMPPWFADPKYGHFANQRKLSGAETATLVKWAENGAPEGDAKDKPAPRHWVDGWNIGQPDKIYELPKPYKVPAHGVVEYTYYVIPTGFTEDTWVSAAEVRPGNRAVVHHVIAFVRPPGSQWMSAAKPGEPFVPVTYERDENGAARRRLSDREGGMSGVENLVGYAPGLQPQRFDLGGAAKMIPAGSDLILQMHYTASGQEAEDLSRIGLIYAKNVPLRRFVVMNATNAGFKIPPGDADYEVHSQVTLQDTAELVWLMPHMHLRGKDFEFRAVYPSGESEVLLRVPKFDFNWQLAYEESKPITLPKGTRLECTAHFDNSPNNPANPNPKVEVRWGDQSWEEMMIGWFAVVIDAKSDPSVLQKRPRTGD